LQDAKSILESGSDSHWQIPLYVGAIKHQPHSLLAVQLEPDYAPSNIRTGIFFQITLRSFSLTTRDQQWSFSFTILDHVTQIVTGIIDRVSLD
jgi:hypothetical protein